MRSLAAFRGLLMKEVFHILRDRRTLFVVIAMPIIQMVLFGFAIRTDVQEIRLLVVDPAPDAETRAVANRFRAVPEVRLVEVVPSDRSLAGRFERGSVDQALLLESGFARALGSPSGASALVVTDGASPLTASATESFALGILRSWSRDRAAGGTLPGPVGAVGSEAVRSGAPRSEAPRVEAHAHFAFNPAMESRLLFVPGVLVFVLTIVSALMTAITVAREKETGTLEVLMVSPLRPLQIVPGKVAAYLGLAFLNALTTLGVAAWLFRVPLHGSLLLLLAECVLYVAVCLALGVLISTFTPTQRTAMLGALLLTMLPTAVLSGMIFPVESMPDFIRPLAYLVPAKWFLDVVRGVMLKGASLEVLWMETAILVAMATALLAASVRSFQLRLG